MILDPFETGSTAGGNERDAELAELFCEHVRRLESGETLDPDEIRRRNPRLADRLIAELQSFERLGADLAPSDPRATLGDYTLRRQIGRGGMGVVYHAWQNSVERPVALKMLPAGIAADPRSVSRFVREARIAAKLQHPCIVSVYGMGVEADAPYFAMEYVEGETLARLLARVTGGGPGTPTPFGHRGGLQYFHELASAFAGVADGLQHAHSRDVVHRDIKPSNLILEHVPSTDLEDEARFRGVDHPANEGRGRRLRILDFGLARLAGQESLTLPGDLLGTPLYMSPEQARRKKVPVDHRTDIYSLGATLYEVLTGRPPLRGRDHADTLSQIVAREPTEPRKIDPDVPGDLQTIVLKCLRKEAEDRYGTAEALAQDLRRFVRGDPIEARPVAAWERLAARFRRHRAAVLTSIALLLLLCLVAWFALEGRRAELEWRRERYPNQVHDALVKLSPGLYGFEPLSFTDLALRQVLTAGARAPLTEAEARRILAGPAPGSIEEAAEELAGLVDDLPRERDAHFYLARAYALLGRFDEAGRELRETLEIDPGFVPARVLLDAADQSIATGDPPGAGSGAGPRPAGVRRGSWGALWLRGFEAAGQRDWRSVVEVCDELLGRFPAAREPYIGFRIEARLARGTAHLQLGDFELAQEDFAGVARGLAPDCRDAHLMLARAYHLAGKPELADLTVHALLENDREGRDEVTLAIVALFILLQDYERAGSWAATLPPALCHRVDAFLCLQREDWPGALEAARQAVRDSPGELRPALLLGSALKNAVARGGLDRASLIRELLEVAEGAVRIAPDDRDARFLLASSREIARAGEHTDLVPTRTIRDDFTRDPDPTDCDPLCWQTPGRFRGDFSPAPASGGLALVALPPGDGILLTGRTFTGDVTIRIRGAFNGNDRPDAYLAVVIHWDRQRGGLYYAHCRPTGVVRLRVFVPPRGEENDVGRWGEIQLDPDHDVEIELCSVGRRAELRVWQPERGEVRPGKATLDLEPAGVPYTWGPVGFGGLSHDGPPLCIRSVTIVE